MIRDNRKCYGKFIQRKKSFVFRVKTEIEVEADAIICAGWKTFGDISRVFTSYRISTASNLSSSGSYRRFGKSGSEASNVQNCHVQN